MGSILFSITTNSRPDLLRRQIDNINHFCPNSVICIHVAANAAFTQQELSTYVDVENVIINPVSYEVVPNKGCLHAHIGNFRHAVDQGVAFSKILLFSPDELLLKHGVAAYVNGHALGSQIELYDVTETYESWSVFRQDILAAPEMEKFLAGLGLPIFAGGQAEGQFFSKDIFITLERLFTLAFPMAPCGFPSEQVVPATISMRYGMNGLNVGMPITFIDHNSHAQFSDQVITQILTGNGAIYAPGKAKSIRPIHIGSCVLNDVYALSCTDSKGYDPWDMIQKQRSQAQEDGAVSVSNPIVQV